jgi:hypothetical protein
MTHRARIALVVFAVLAGPAAAAAQWVNYPAPGVPRLPDGKPDLAAPAPRLPDGRPDLQGIWMVVSPPAPGKVDFFFDLARDLPPDSVVMTPWAQGIQRQREQRDHVDDPYGYCLTPGVPRINVIRSAFKIVQARDLTALLYELDTAPVFRQVHTDGRPLPASPEPTWLGYSIGAWEGDTFVITTTGLRDGGWLDTQKARPHSDALRVTERLRRPTVGRLEMTITIDDPKAFVKPWTVQVPFALVANRDLFEGSCVSHAATMERRRIAPPPPEPPSPPLPAVQQER